MTMKKITHAIALAAVLAAVAAPAALAGKSLSGTWSTTVSNAGSLNGTYKISFSPGHFTLKAPYNITGHGTYSISGSRITIHGPGSECSASGVYSYSESGSTLSFHRISDPCRRSKILTAHALKKV